MSNINQNCQCPDADCPRHGNCKACMANHKGKSFCKRPLYIQKMVRFFTDLKLKTDAHNQRMKEKQRK